MEQQHLIRTEAVKKMQELVDEINVCLFQTGSGDISGTDYRPMATKGVDEEGVIWFFSPKDSEKNRDITEDPRVKLIYAHPGKSAFLIVKGMAEIIFDREKITELWNSLDKTWFKEGVDDPDISIIKVKPVDAHYWDTKGNQMVNFVKMVASVATGKMLVHGEEGTLKI